MSEAKCARRGTIARTYEFDNDSTFWGWITTKVTTATTRTVRARCTYYRRQTTGTPVLTADDESALCSDCWSLLIGRFMQGRDVPALASKVGR